MMPQGEWCPFCRRVLVERWDEHGLSVAPSPEAAARVLPGHKGIIRIDLDKLPPEYTVEPDPEDADHMLIQGLPFDLGQDNSDEEQLEVIRHANALVACSDVI
jgi:hypothetical protein